MRKADFGLPFFMEVKKYEKTSMGDCTTHFIYG